ncbi:MAG: response regulator [Bdellovibrionales bacterium]|nr:response regulator [Bdellovibrionales bacterium]
MVNSLNILIVEDNEGDAELISRSLKKANYVVSFERVETITGLKKALERPNWDIVFSDFQLPGFDAVSALETFKTFNLDIPFIVISGTIGEEAAVNLIKLGAQNYVMKGNLQKLPSIVANELAEALERKEHKELEAKSRQENVEKVNFFKSNLQYLLETKGIKQSQLSRDVGISKQTISDWLKKDSLLSVHQALKLTNFFKISVEDLLTSNLKITKDIHKEFDFDFIKKLETPVQIISFDGLDSCGNQAFCDLLGFSEYELNSRIFSEIIHQEDLQHGLLNLRRAGDEGYFCSQMDLRYVSIKYGFRWLRTICVSALNDKKIFLFSFPEKDQPIEPLTPDYIPLGKLATKELERMQAVTQLSKKLEFLSDIDPKLWININRDIFRCLIRSLFNQFQFIDFESSTKYEVILKSRVEKNEIHLIAMINCAINPKRLDLARVQKVASLIGASVVENYAGNVYSFSIVFPK